MKVQVKNKQPLMEVLVELSPDSSKTTLREWIKGGRVTVDERVVRIANQEVLPGQFVVIGARKLYLDEGITILYEDSDIVVIDKPSGILSVAAAYEKELTVHGILKEKYYPKMVYVVHRLDQETSGVMMFALNEKARDELKNMFEKHDLVRRYTVIVQGLLMPLKSTWKSYLWEDTKYYVHTSDDSTKGQEAITHYQVKGKSKSFTLLEVTLETGRKNQIRVHCQAAGFPVSGDKKYGGKTSPIRRLCLHAHILEFNHPTTHKMMRFASQIPDEFYRVVPQ